MNVKGMSPRYARTDNSNGVKLNDYLQRQEFKQAYNAKFALPKRDTYCSTDRFIQVPQPYSSTLREDGCVEIQDAGKEDPSAVWKELAEKYDVRNASFDDIKEISAKLYNAGQITLFECAMLTFDPSESPQSVRPNLFLTQSDADGRRDWIAEYEARSARDWERGNLQGYKNNQRVLEILKKLS